MLSVLMFTAFDLYQWLPSIITAVFTGGGVLAIVALLKVRPEAGQIVVTAAQGALIVQSGVMDELRKDLDRVKKESLAEIEKLKAELKLAKLEIERLTCIIKTMQEDQLRHDGEIKLLGVKEG